MSGAQSTGKASRWTLLTLALLIALASITAIDRPLIKNSPDGNALQFFSTLYATDGELSQPADGRWLDLAHPRNAVIANGNVVPMSFFGPILAQGGVQSLLGKKAAFVWINTMGIAVFVIYLFLLIRRFLGERTALVTVALTLFFLLDASITLQLSLLTAAVYYFAADIQRPSLRQGTLWSLLMTAAILVRYEYVLVFLLLACGRIAATRHWKTTGLLVLMTGAACAAVILPLNAALYGDPWTVGYALDYKSQDTAFSKASSSFDRVIKYVAPYGIDPPEMLRTLREFVIDLNPWLFVAGLVGAGIALRRCRTSMPLAVLLVTLVIISVFLLAYYGSNPSFYRSEEDPFNSSYVRYLAPLYVLEALLVSFVLSSALRRSRDSHHVAILLLLLALQVQFASSQHDGLDLRVRQAQRYDAFVQDVEKITSPNDVVLTSYWDKILWGHRPIVTGSVSATPKSITALIERNLAVQRVFIFKDSRYYPSIQVDKRFLLKRTEVPSMYEVVLR